MNKSMTGQTVSVDPVTLAVVSGALDNSIREMTITMRRAAMSPVLAIGNDFSNAIFDGNARLVMQGQDQPVHIGALIFACKAVAQYFGSDLAPGDVIYHNDPRTGGSHLQDMTLYKPVFVGDQLAFWTVNRSHMNETGGPVAGGYNPTAEEIWAEGLRISPVKIYERGRPRRDVIDLLLTNFRTRRQFRGDLGAQLAACTLAEKRLVQLVQRYGLETIRTCLEALLNRAESLMRAEISRMPDGEYKGSAIVEGDGSGYDDLEIKCTISIQAGELKAQFVSPPAVRRYVNSYAANSMSAAYLGVLTFVDPTLPHNEGLYRPVQVDLGPGGTLINATEPAACGLSTNTPLEQIADAVREALSHAWRERAGAAWAHACVNSVSGVDPRYGEPYSYYLHASGWGGGGAFWGSDGEPCLGSIGAAGAAMIGDIEMIEQAAPLHVHRYELITDSGGPGRWRGGLSCVFEFEVVEHDATMSQFGDGMKYPAAGVLGAESPFDSERVFRKQIRRGGGEAPEMIPLHWVGDVNSGERVLIHCAGGGGVGRAAEREIEAVEADVRGGHVSIERASLEYAVVVDPVTLKADSKATAELRSRPEGSVAKP
jgi:N-methylhydantoinase B